MGQGDPVMDKRAVEAGDNDTTKLMEVKV